MEKSDAWAMRTAHKGDGEWSLDLLVKLIEETGGTFPITVLLGGTFIKGMLVNSTEWADHLDDAMETLLGTVAETVAAGQPPVETVEDLASADTSLGDLEMGRAKWRAEKGWRHWLDEQRAERAAAEERLDGLTKDGEPVPFESLPEDLAQIVVALELPKVALTLKDATIVALTPTAAPTTIPLPYVRVLMENIDAWWPGTLAATTDAPGS